MGLLDELREEEARSTLRGGRDYGCTACDAIRACEDNETREALSDALAGRLGVTAVLRLSARNGLGIGRDGVLRHRREDHRP